MKCRYGFLVCAFVAALFFFSPVATAADVDSSAPLSAPALTPVENEVLVAVNVERVRRGLPALVADAALMLSARRHCEWMSRHGFQHASGVIENIAQGQQTSVSVMTRWMNSSGHRANILNRGVSVIGIAAYKAPNGQMYWVQQFRARPVVTVIEKEKAKETTVTVTENRSCANGTCSIERTKVRRVGRRG